ncbi:hypothetical protein BMS3Bbin16_01098 [archaeon BMS3Bbin16]|nr:hypothetical protein BMS3Bbin16_01098 [archaeon BMS3Bbin16]
MDSSSALSGAEVFFSREIFVAPAFKSLFSLSISFLCFCSATTLIFSSSFLTLANSDSNLSFNCLSLVISAPSEPVLSRAASSLLISEACALSILSCSFFAKSRSALKRSFVSRRISISAVMPVDFFFSRFSSVVYLSSSFVLADSSSAIRVAEVFFRREISVAPAFKSLFSFSSLTFSFCTVMTLTVSSSFLMLASSDSSPPFNSLSLFISASLDAIFFCRPSISAPSIPTAPWDFSSLDSRRHATSFSRVISESFERMVF